MNAVNADATADRNTAAPTDTSVNAVGDPKPPAKKTADPGSEPPPSKQPGWDSCSKHWKHRKQTDMDYRIDWGVNPIPHAMPPTGRFGVGLRVVNLRVVVAIRVVVAVKAVVAIRVVVAVRAKKGKEERRTGGDVRRSAQRRPL